MATFYISGDHVVITGVGNFFPFGCYVPVDPGQDAWSTNRSDYLGCGQTFLFSGNQVAYPSTVESNYLNDNPGIGPGKYAILCVDFFGQYPNETPQGSHTSGQSHGHYLQVPKPGGGTYGDGEKGDDDWHLNWFTGIRGLAHYSRVMSWFNDDEPFNPDFGAYGYDANFEEKPLGGHDQFAGDSADKRLRFTDFWGPETLAQRQAALAKTDVLGINDYPNSDQKWRTPNGAQWAVNHKNDNNDGKARAVIPFVPGSSAKGLGSADDARFFLYSTLAHGARGISFYTHYSGGTLQANFSAIQAAWNQWNGYNFANVVFTGMGGGVYVTNNANDVATYYSTRYGSNLSENIVLLSRYLDPYLYIFAANDWESPMNSVTFQLPTSGQYENNVVTVIDEARSLRISGATKQFTDSFNGFRSHVYRITVTYWPG